MATIKNIALSINKIDEYTDVNMAALKLQVPRHLETFPTPSTKNDAIAHIKIVLNSF